MGEELDLFEKLRKDQCAQGEKVGVQIRLRRQAELDHIVRCKLG